MHFHADDERSILQARCVPGSMLWPYALAFSCLMFFSMSCNDEAPPESPPRVVEEAPTPTHLRVHTLSLMNTAFNAQRGAGYVDMYSGAAYGDQDAADHGALIDFRHQYRGRDIANQRSLESLTTKTRWDRIGLFTNVAPTESKIQTTEMDEAAFDRIENADDLVESFDFQPMLEASAKRYRRAYLSNIDDVPLAAVFAFVDKKGRRGLFKIVRAERAPIDTVAEGMLTIEIKIEDRED